MAGESVEFIVVGEGEDFGEEAICVIVERVKYLFFFYFFLDIAR